MAYRFFAALSRTHFVFIPTIGMCTFTQGNEDILQISFHFCTFFAGIQITEENDR